MKSPFARHTLALTLAFNLAINLAGPATLVFAQDDNVKELVVPQGDLLNLGSYLDQVKNQNLTLKANDYSARAFRLRVSEASLDFMPYAIGNALYSDNKEAQISPLYGNETVAQKYSLGVQEKFRTGTLVALTYNLSMTQINGGQPYVPGYGFYTGSPEISITQPLWNDFNASLSKANEEATLATLHQQEVLSQYSTQQIVYNAETAYWLVALDREIVRLDREAIDRTAKILRYNRRRVSMNVADRSDLLQAEASMKTKELTYQTDTEALRQASLQFNSVRNIAGDDVTEKLQPIEDYLKTDMPRELKRLGDRADVIAAVSGSEATRAQAKASAVKLQPVVNFVGTYQLSGHGTDYPTAAGTSWNGDAPYYTAGLNLSIPLDRGAVDDMNKGYQAQSAAAEATAARARFDLDQDWLNLNKQLKDALSRLDLAKEIEDLQKEKLTWERERFSTGRTTSFQVLTFEDNFSDAELSRLRVENELITVRAKARLYNGDVK